MDPRTPVAPPPPPPRLTCPPVPTARPHILPAPPPGRIEFIRTVTPASTGGAPRQPVGQRPRTPAAVPSQMTSDDLRALWNRVGVRVGLAATRLLKPSNFGIVGSCSYE